MIGRHDDVALGVGGALIRRLVGAGGGAALQPALVAAQALLDAQRRLVGARIGIRRHAVGMQRDAGIEMNGAFGAEAEAFLADRDVARIAAVEIFCHRLGDPRIHAVAQGLADVEIATRYAERHWRLHVPVLPPANSHPIGS